MASGTLTNSVIMGMDVGRAILNGIQRRHVPFQPLVQIPGLCDVDGNPTSICGLSGINEVAGPHLELRVNRVNRVGIFLSRLAGPLDQVRRRSLPRPVMTE